MAIAARHEMTYSDATPLAIDPAAETRVEAPGSKGRKATASRASLVHQLFERYRSPLLRYLRGLLSSPDDAEDVVQETYTRLLQAPTLDRAESRVRGYIFKIATNLAYDHFRQRKTRGTQVTYDESLPSDACLEPASIVSFGQGLEIIKEVLLEVRPRSRQVFLMRASQHLTYDEIAVRLGVSSRTVEREMRHAIDLCQRRLRIERAK